MKPNKPFYMNLHQLNTNLPEALIKSADYNIRQYTKFIENSIALLKKESFSINILKSIVNGETRYEPIENQKDRKSQKAKKVLFEENTRFVYESNKGFRKEDEIKIDKNVDENYFTADNEIISNTIYLRPDTSQLNKQKQALKNLLYQPLREHMPLLELFGNPEYNLQDSFNYDKVQEWFILNDHTKDGVTEQRKFVQKAISTPDFALLEGPPGSGKTTTIIEIIMQLAQQGKRILLCSATHAAVDNVIERITERYKGVCEKEIVPVRISRDRNAVKENVQPYLLQNLTKTYKDKIKNFLTNNQALESQKFLYKNIDNEKDNFIEKIILESANLVCGTMVGILQHPTIKENKQGASFDVLIVDESSKVTFQDFIIPALHAKKWILVGDVKQLSPFVEDDYVSENLASLIEGKMQEQIIKQFELRQKLDLERHNKHIKVYFSDDIENEIFDFLDKDLVITKVKNDFPKEKNVLINASDVLICQNSTQVKKILSDNLLIPALFFNEKPDNFGLNFRQNYFHKNKLFYFESKNETWASTLASKISQKFSFRNAGEEFKDIEKELAYLIPDIEIGELDYKTKQPLKFIDKINEIKRLVFPSILEMLQNGVGKTQGQHNNKVLSDGLSQQAKQYRFESLTYQHRMHPDIAKTSKENFYTEFENLKPANTVLQNRNWQYALNEPTVKWVTNNDNTFQKGKIINPTEVEDIKNELKKFCDWAKDNPKIENGKNEPYEIAILNFYLEQDRELRKMVRKFTNQPKQYAKFGMPNVKIFLYTVDKFQGQEADMVLLGFTKTGINAFYNSPNRLNVALTRARHKLVLFGNQKWFQNNAKLKALRDLANNFSAILKTTT